MEEKKEKGVESQVDTIKKSISKEKMLWIVFFGLTVLHVVFLLITGFLKGGVFRFYVTLYILSRLLMVFSLYCYYKQDVKVFKNQTLLINLIDLSIIVIFCFYIGKAILIACGLSVIEGFMLLEIRKNVALNKPELYMFPNLAYALSMIIIFVCFCMVFLGFVFTDVPVFKQIATAIRITIEGATKAANVAGGAAKAVGGAVGNAANAVKDTAGNVANGIGGFFGNLFN